MIRRLTMLAIVLAALCTPRGAEAQSKYLWKDGNGAWNVPGRWTLLEGPLNDGYPNRPGDEAIFTAPYSGPLAVQIPQGVTVTVGAIFFSSTEINIFGSGRMVMKHPSFRGAQIARIEPPPAGFDKINVPIELRSDLTVAVAPPNARINFTGTISNNLCACGVTKLGPGRMDMRAINTYLGQTVVERGLLVLEEAAASSVRGSMLRIGPPTPEGNTVVAEVAVNSPNQIADDTPVEVKLGGLLTVANVETLGPTTVTRGWISAQRSPTVLAFTSLNMTGGVIDSRSGAELQLLGTLTATAAGPFGALIQRVDGDGMLNLGASSRTFDVTRGAGAVDLRMLLPITGANGAGVIKQGNGMLWFDVANVYQGETWIKEGELRTMTPANVDAIKGPVRVGLDAKSALLTLVNAQNILDTVPVMIGANGTINAVATDLEVLGALTIDKGGRLNIGNGATANLSVETLVMRGGRIEMPNTSSLRINGAVDLMSVSTAAGVEAPLIGGGRLALGGARTILTGRGPAESDGIIASIIVGSATQGVTKTGEGTLTFTGNNTYGGAATIMTGRLNINGKQPASPVAVKGGILGGKGTTGPVTVSAGGSVSPGDKTGRLSTGPITYSAGSSQGLYLEGSDEGQYGQLGVTGTVTLGNARFGAGTKTKLSPDAHYVIIANDGNDPVIGKFEGINEGDNLTIGGVPYTITYRGGDGNDVVIEGLTPLTYYLAEGATGAFFDDDVLIANPNDAQAPVTLTFLREGGATVVVQRVIPAMSRVTIHVDQLEGLQDVSASVKVESTDRLPLVVERSMFWDQSYYGGHTANAVARPEKQWTFAEGFQGFFDTYILIANANASKATATLTFLRENDTPVVKSVEVAPFSRKTVYAGDYDELKGRAFGIVVDATEPVIAERAMYFATLPGKLWSGGHVNTGIVAPSNTWFHAEGATGGFFSTFILLSNPQDTKANVEVRFLLADGTVIKRMKTLEPKQRLTINPASEGDARLEDAAVSTVVQSDVPIVSERSMYWEGDVKPIGEGHNSSGIAEAGERWGLAEGRIGLGRAFDTYILLANPSATKASVRITYLREGGAPIVKEYDVPATSRFNVDVKTVVPELQNSSFGAIIEVLNDVPIAVERSLYWDANGAFWAGGTNALATRLPPVK